MSTKRYPKGTLWDDLRLVVVDCETTGLQQSARVLSIAIYVVERGTIVKSYSTLVNPGGFIGATHIHGLDAEKLTEAKGFAACQAEVAELFTPSSKRTYVAGHHVDFDVRRLTYEFRLLGLEPPAMMLLDTTRLAPAAGVGSARSSLASLAAGFELINPSPHDASADALISAEILVRSIDRLIEQGVTDLSPYAVAPSRRAFADEEEADYELTEEHLAAHSVPLRGRSQREDALEQCLDWECPVLNRRIEDGATSSESARDLLSWCLAWLECPDLTRYQLGLIADGAVRVIIARRQILTKPHPRLLLDNVTALFEGYNGWEPCSDDDQCDQCFAQRPSRCRFVLVPRRAVYTTLYSREDRVDLDSARAFLYDGRRALGVGSRFYSLVHLHADAAVVGAVVAARVLRSLREGPAALAATTEIWTLGFRSAELAEVHAALVEDNYSRAPRPHVLNEAMAICDEALRGREDDPGYERLRARRRRLVRAIEAAAKPAPANPYNRRPPHAVRFVGP